MKRILLSLIFCFLAINAYSFDVKTKGFMTIATSTTDSHLNYEKDLNHHWNFIHDSRMGLNFSGNVTDKMSVHSQLLNKYDRNDNDFRLSLDWAHGTYKVMDNLVFRLGKQKLPVWLISDYYDVGFLYPWIRPPEEIYALAPITTITGSSVGYNIDIANLNYAMDFFIGEGTVNIEQYMKTIGMYRVQGRGLCHGINLNISNDYFGIKATWGLNSRTNATQYLAVPAAVNAELSQTDANLKSNLSIRYEFWSIGGRADYKNAFLVSEWARGDVWNRSTLTMGKTRSSTAWYSTIGYNIGIFAPHFTFATITTAYDPVTSSLGNFNGYNSKQESYTAGVKTKINDYSDVKVEGKLIKVKEGNGLVYTTISNIDDIKMVSLAYDVIF